MKEILASEKLEIYNKLLEDAKLNLSNISSTDIDEFMLIPMFVYLKFLNTWAKHPDFPIAKNTFYSFKQDILEYILLNDKLNLHWKIDPKVEEQITSDGNSIYLCKIYIEILGNTYVFHQQLKGIVAAIAYPFLDVVIPYKRIEDADNHDNISNRELIAIWRNLLSLCERHNWFLYHHKNPYGYVKNLNNRYIDLNLHGLQNLKNNSGFNTRVQTIGITYRINQWRKSFYDIKNKFNLIINFNLHLKNNNIDNNLDEIEIIYLTK